MCEGLDVIGLKHNVPEGAYYIMIDVSEFMGRTACTSNLEFAELLCEKVGVSTVPGSSFFHEPVNNYVRIHFAKKNETLNEALNRLNDIRNKLS